MLNETEYNILLDLVRKEELRQERLIPISGAKDKAQALNTIWRDLYYQREEYKEQVAKLKQAHGR